MRIDYLPGIAWQGRLPDPFYGTLVALTLAWRGIVPFHACAVAIDGHAVLIAGRSGAGKSSLTASLIGAGALLIADDLSAVRVQDGSAAVLPGRPGVRQHSETAARIEAVSCKPIAGDPRGKWMVRPRARAAGVVLPLAGIVALTDEPGELDAHGKVAMLAANLFRPRWLSGLSNHVARRRDLLTIAAGVPIATFPGITTFDPREQDDRAARGLARIRAMIVMRR